ncbi:MAG TPA: NUDIX domain-containing protein [Afifellaceae bacterium]|nr:NUDIX domain-containing protein [Afifellaceae bacterium]
MSAGEDYRKLIRDRPELFANLADGIRVETEPGTIAAIAARVRRRYEAAGHPSGWAETGVVYVDPWIAVLRDAVTFPDGSVGLHSRVLCLGGEVSGVAICPRLGAKLVIIRQFRHATRRWHWEFPRGGRDGEPGEAAAAREIEEEIGARVTRIEPLGLVHGATHVLANAVALYLADIEAFGEPQRSEGIAEIRLMGGEELAGMIREGEITDAFTIAAFARARLRGLL